MQLSDFVTLRVRLDSPDKGLTLKEFRDMHGQCTGCERFMMIRGKDHHRCPGKYILPQMVSDEQLFFLLDSTDGGRGLTANQFSYLFASCNICGHIFTRMAGVHHVHNA